VLSRSGYRSGEGVWVATSLQEAIDLAERELAESETFVAGGAQVYRAALAQEVVDRMFLTLVQAEVEADTYFPPYPEAEWTASETEPRPPDERNSYQMTFTTLVRTTALRP
jgi:dihydrofolate reductase